MEAIGLNIKDLTVDKIKEFALLETTPERLSYILKSFDVKESTAAGSISRELLILEFFCDNLCFSLGCGLSGKHIQVHIFFIERLVMQTAVKGLSMDDAQQLLKTLIQECYEKSMPSSFAILVIDYLKKTFLQHYHLYQYLFNYDQDKLTSHELILIEVPCPGSYENNNSRHISPLKDGMTLEQWNKEQKVKEINGRWQAIKEARSKTYQEKRSSLEKMSEDCAKKLETSIQTASKEQILPSIVDCIRTDVSLVSIQITEEFEAFADDIAHRMEKAALDKEKGPQKLKQRPKSKAKKGI